MTTSCYLPVFYCFLVKSFDLVRFLKFSLKNFRDCFIVQLSMFFVVSHLMCNFLSLTHFVLFVNNFFNLFFQVHFKLFAVFATAIIDYHIFMFLSTTFLISFSCFLSRCTAHATACIYYHCYQRLSTPFLYFFYFSI